MVTKVGSVISTINVESHILVVVRFFLCLQCENNLNLPLNPENGQQNAITTTVQPRNKDNISFV